jgi:hypothetical protein
MAWHALDFRVRAALEAKAATLGRNDAEAWWEAKSDEDRAGYLHDLAYLTNIDPATVEAFEHLHDRNLAGTEATFCRWLEMKDPIPLRATLAAVAAHRLGGDSLGLMLVGGSGSLKTELLLSLSEVGTTVVASSIKGPASLLSGTPKRDADANATGGLLREVGNDGVLVLKDFTSILSLQRDTRAEVLAALREIADGSWVRIVGSEGGRRLSWRGRCSMLAACTTAIDTAHGVLSVFGNRFLVVRTGGEARWSVARRAMVNATAVAKMRTELAAAVGGLFDDPLATPPWPEDEDLDLLARVADLVSLARSPVERDHHGEIALVGDPDSPSRVAKVLLQIRQGALALGYPPTTATEIVLRVAGDSLPKLRRLVFLALADGGEWSTADVGVAVDHPTRSTRRALEDLVAHGVAVRSKGPGNRDRWRLSREAVRLAQLLNTTSCKISGTAPQDSVPEMFKQAVSPSPSAADFEQMWDEGAQ